MLRKPSIFARLAVKIRSLPKIIAAPVRSGLERRPGEELARKVGIEEANPTAALPESRPKIVVRARLNSDAEDIAPGAPLRPKVVVRVLPSADDKDNWIKNINLSKPPNP